VRLGLHCRGFHLNLLREVSCYAHKNVSSKFWQFFHPKILELNKLGFVWAILPLYCDYLHKAIRYHQTENGIVNCNTSLILTMTSTRPKLSSSPLAFFFIPLPNS